jgi:hypothetical protein
MKHSKRESSSRGHKGFSKSPKDNLSVNHRHGPIIIEDILARATRLSKSDAVIREMEVRTEPANEASPRIKRKFRPLDNPSSVIEVLRAILVIKEGVAGNNVTTGPLQYQYWRTCLDGTALSKFNEFAVQVGNETTAHLVLVERRLVTYFAPREVLSQQARYIRHYMRKPAGISTRQYVSAVHVLNNMIGQLPPAFEANQKILEPDLMDILVSKAPKTHRELMVEQGFNPQTASTDEFVEICERAESKDALQKSVKKSDDDDSEDERPTRKTSKKHRTSEYTKAKKSPFYCKEHGPNTTHDSGDCKVIHGNKKDWKKKDTSSSDYKAKYKKKHRELNLLQLETKREKAKWTKAYKKLTKSAGPDTSDSSSDGEVSKHSDSVRSKREPDINQDSSPSDRSSSASDTDSE